VSTFVDHLRAFDQDEAVRLGIVVKFCARIGMSDGNLNGFDVQLLREVDGGANAFLGLAGQAKYEVPVHDQAELPAILGELAGALYGGTLLDVLQNLRVA
jgi:hypothetical protein